jgi:hypothetical protein
VFANKWLAQEPQPFFGSGAKQHTSDTLKDMKLALFTGERPAGDMTGPVGYKHSRSGTEVPQIWRPQETASQQPLSFSGAAASASQHALLQDAARFSMSTLQNNVNPLGQPEQVAPERDPLKMRVMPVDAATKQAGRDLVGLMPMGFSSSISSAFIEGQQERQVQQQQQIRQVRRTDEPTQRQQFGINTTFATAPGTTNAERPRLTRVEDQEQPRNRPVPTSLQGAAYAPSVSLCAPSCLEVERVAPRRQEAQKETGELAFGQPATSRGSGFVETSVDRDAHFNIRRQQVETGAELAVGSGMRQFGLPATGLDGVTAVTRQRSDLATHEGLGSFPAVMAVPAGNKAAVVSSVREAARAAKDVGSTGFGWSVVPAGSGASSSVSGAFVTRGGTTGGRSVDRDMHATRLFGAADVALTDTNSTTRASRKQDSGQALPLGGSRVLPATQSDESLFASTAQQTVDRTPMLRQTRDAAATRLLPTQDTFVPAYEAPRLPRSDAPTEYVTQSTRVFGTTGSDGPGPAAVAAPKRDKVVPAASDVRNGASTVGGVEPMRSFMGTDTRKIASFPAMHVGGKATTVAPPFEQQRPTVNKMRLHDAVERSPVGARTDMVHVTAAVPLQEASMPSRKPTAQMADSWQPVPETSLRGAVDAGQVGSSRKLTSDLDPAYAQAAPAGPIASAVIAATTDTLVPTTTTLPKRA